MNFRKTLLILLIPFATALRAANDLTPESVLSDQVKAIVDSRSPYKAKEKAIASAVKFAVLAAIADAKDQANTLKIALRYAATAAQAVPDFADTIIEAVISIPAIAAIDGAAEQIQSTVTLVAKQATVPGTPPGSPANAKPPPTAEYGGNIGDVIVSPSS
jgi:hypothetical protein